MSVQPVLDLSMQPSHYQSLAAIRSALFAFFAGGFGYPNASQFERFASGVFWTEMRELIDLLGIRSEVCTKPSPTRAQSVIDLRVCYTALFDVCGSRPRVSLLERRYVDKIESEQSLWEDLLRFYRHFGLDFASGRTEENPDHLLLQLEFMHYMTFLEAGAPPKQRKSLQRAQHDFLDSHLGRWVNTLHEQLAKQATPGPYATLAKSLAEFVVHDHTYLDSQISERS